MDTAPPGLLSWQPGTLSPQLNCQKFRKSSSRKHQWARQSKANNVGVTGRRAHLAKWCSQSERSLRDRVSVVPKRGTTDSLASNSSHSLSGCNGSGLSEVVRRKVHPCRHVCNAADNGALYSSADLSANGSYDSKGHEGNGSVVHAEEQSFLLRLSLFWKAIRSFFPNGSWWRVIERQHQRAHNITFTGAMQRLWVLISPDKLIIGLAFAALVIAALSEITIPHFVAAMIFSAQKGMTSDFYGNAKLLVLMSCTYGLFSGIRGGCFGIANQILVKRMRELLFSTLLSQDIAFFDAESVGALTSRLGSDCQQVSRIIGNDLNIMFRNGLQGLGAFMYLVTLSWQLALTTLGVCSLMWFLTTIYGRYQKRTSRFAQDLIASANEVAEEAFSLLRVVRTFGTEQQEVGRYSKWLQKLMEINLRQNIAYAFSTLSSCTLYHGTQVVALIIGGGFVMSGQISAEKLTKFILYSEWVVHSTWWVGDHWASLMQAIGASEKVFQLLDLPPSLQLTAPGITLPNVQGCVQFVDISFSYPTRPKVGLSGSGKSTLVSLLLRLYEPSSGQVVVDGVPLQDLDIRWFRKQLGVVSQEPRLFSMDIASNIAYGCDGDVDQMEIERAAKLANAHDFIISLPDGYKTMVDNTRLSGGQKQRIAIARALLRDPAILVLDEATSALDAESEHLVQKALDRAMRGDGGRNKRTVLVIAHRLSTIRAADRIVVMTNGQVSETGSHEELLKLDGDYARLTKRQLSTLSQ
uniref:Uncharacterized protein n=1 Tax=Physcomitrium patens TaxID=3218 RepID=A0A2K1IX63_PHYPA|nr:hypothetical protein PHYPA_023683 [Physcomitrium patens]